jgi:hypothetical protein
MCSQVNLRVWYVGNFAVHARKYGGRENKFVIPNCISHLIIANCL